MERVVVDAVGGLRPAGAAHEDAAVEAHRLHEQVEHHVLAAAQLRRTEGEVMQW